MKISTRRGALLLCTLALNVFYFFSPPATAVLGARRCQQECDANQGACGAACLAGRSVYTPMWDLGPDYVNCVQDCDAAWTSCSMSAITCAEPGPGNDCWQCDFITQTSCDWFPVGDDFAYICYDSYQNSFCYQVASAWCW